MKISRDQKSRNWLLSSESGVLYKGPKSPWDHPSIIREALQREAEGSADGPKPPRRREATAGEPSATG